MPTLAPSSHKPTVNPHYYIISLRSNDTPWTSYFSFGIVQTAIGACCPTKASIIIRRGQPCHPPTSDVVMLEVVSSIIYRSGNLERQGRSPRPSERSHLTIIHLTIRRINNVSGSNWCLINKFWGWRWCKNNKVKSQQSSSARAAHFEPK